MITLDTGIEAAVLEAGGGGRPLLLLHGITSAKEDFVDHVPALAERGWWVVAPDLRGHGSSSRPDDEAAFSLHHFALDARALVSAMGWSRLAVLGHSMGGMVAQMVALELTGDPAGPEVSGVVLVGTTHGPVEHVDPAMAELGAAIAREEGMGVLRAALDALGEDAPLRTPAGDRLLDEDPVRAEAVHARFLRSSAAMYATMILQLVDQPDRLDRLRRLSVPALVVVGDQDRAFLEPSRRLAAALPEAELRIVHDAGHNPHAEQPGRFREVLLDFLDGLARG